MSSNVAAREKHWHVCHRHYSSHYKG